MHVLGPFDRYPLAENRSYTCPPSTAEDYENLQRTLGIDRCVVSTAAPTAPVST